MDSVIASEQITENKPSGHRLKIFFFFFTCIPLCKEESFRRAWNISLILIFESTDY